MQPLLFIICIICSTLAHSAQVYVPISNPSEFITDLIFVERLAPIGVNVGSADLSNGEFKVISTASNGVGQSVYTGLFTTFNLTLLSAARNWG